MSDQGDTRDRRPAPIQRGGQRKHMGTATSDPDYLTPTGFEHNGRQALNAYMSAKHQQKRGAQPLNDSLKKAKGNGKTGKPGQLHYDRYLSTPKPGRSIFISQHDRKRKHLKMLITVLVILIIALALVWFIFLR